MANKQGKRPRNIGMVFDWFDGAQRPVFHLDRPFDLVPAGGIRYDVSALATLVDETASALHQGGLRSGDRLAIVKNNHFDVVLLAAGAARIGALPAMISATIEPESLRTMMGRLNPKLLVASPTVLTRAAAAGVELVGRDVRTFAVGADEPPAGVARFDELWGGRPVSPAPRRDDEPMICTHTSGTTGVPKLVAHSAYTLLGVLTKLETMPIPFLSTRPTDTIACCIAFVHGRSITWTCAQLVRPPAKVVVLADSEPAGVIRTLSEHPPTTLEACPNIFQRWEGIAESHPELFANTRAFINTFDAIHPRTVRTFLEVSGRRAPVWGQVWGQTEVGPVCMALYTKGKLRTAGGRTSVTSQVGRPIPLFTQVKVVDRDTRQEVPRGQEGIVLVRTKGRCLTYLGEDDRHAEKRWDGWWNTGDIGAQSRLGNLRLVDREVDILPGTSGIELEGVLLDRLPETTEVIVLGPPGRPLVPVISTQDGTLDPVRWKEATGDLPEMESPRIIGWEDFPRTGTWKVRRPVLREQLLGTDQTYGTGRWT